MADKPRMFLAELRFIDEDGQLRRRFRIHNYGYGITDNLTGMEVALGEQPPFGGFVDAYQFLEQTDAEPFLKSDCQRTLAGLWQRFVTGKK